MNDSEKAPPKIRDHSYFAEQLARMEKYEAELLEATTDANDLIIAIEVDSPGLWQLYLSQEMGDGSLSDEIANWILNTQRKRYPKHSLNEHAIVFSADEITC